MKQKGRSAECSTGEFEGFCALLQLQRQLELDLPHALHAPFTGR